jgi:hypothetical protein
MNTMPLLAKLAAAAAIFALAAPAAHAARPAAGSFYNGSGGNGGYLVTSSHAIKELWLYCGGARYAVRELIRIERDGSFRLRHGTAERYGHGGSPRGLKNVRLRGRFTSNSSVRITRTLERCDTNTVVIARER